MRRLARAAAAALLATAAAAQERPSEEDLFGAPARPAPEGPAPAVSREREDPLRVGGLVYLRAQATASEGESPGDYALSSPNLLDVYLDVRPSDRVRGFVLGRMSHDPTLAREATGLAALTGASPPANPDAVLDQLWVNFDVGRRVFVTAGKQHVKWGVGRFWNPTDWLHAQRRDPLAPLDVRTGATLVKVHVPWEARGWNAYGIALLEDLDARVAAPPGAPPSFSAEGGGRLRGVAGGARAEIVLGKVEIGGDALLKDGRRPRFGIDLSAGIWDLDVYAEVAFRTSSDLPRWREVDPAARLDQRYAEDHALRFTPAAVAGGEWSWKYSDEDAVTFGAEWFFDDSGYSNARSYPFLALGALRYAGTPTDPSRFVQQDPAAFTPFYLGRHYAGAWVRLPSPGRWNDTTFSLSGVANLSDRSFVVRLDHSVLALTYLRLETFVAAHLGGKGGEFRFGFDVPAQVWSTSPPFETPAVPVPAPVVDAGIALRVSL